MFGLKYFESSLCHILQPYKQKNVTTKVSPTIPNCTICRVCTCTLHYINLDKNQHLGWMNGSYTSFTSNIVYLKLKSCTEYNTVTRLFEIHYDIYLVKKGVVFCLFFILKYQFVHQNCNSQLGIVAWNQASKKVTFRIIQFFVFVFYWMKFWFISIHYPGILVLF